MQQEPVISRNLETDASTGVETSPTVERILLAQPHGGSLIRVKGPGSHGARAPVLTKSMKQAFIEAFDHMGGARGLFRWASKRVYVLRDGRKVATYPNQDTFYALAAKLVPTEQVIQGAIGHAHYTAVPLQVPVEAREAIPGHTSMVIEATAINELPGTVDAESVEDAQLVEKVEDWLG